MIDLEMIKRRKWAFFFLMPPAMLAVGCFFVFLFFYGTPVDEIITSPLHLVAVFAYGVVEFYLILFWIIAAYSIVRR